MRRYDENERRSQFAMVSSMYYVVGKKKENPKFEYRNANDQNRRLVL